MTGEIPLLVWAVFFLSYLLPSLLGPQTSMLGLYVTLLLSDYSTVYVGNINLVQSLHFVFEETKFYLSQSNLSKLFNLAV